MYFMCISNCIGKGYCMRCACLCICDDIWKCNVYICFLCIACQASHWHASAYSPVDSYHWPVGPSVLILITNRPGGPSVMIKSSLTQRHWRAKRASVMIWFGRSVVFGPVVVEGQAPSFLEPLPLCSCLFSSSLSLWGRERSYGLLNFIDWRSFEEFIQVALLCFLLLEGACLLDC
jgi:hypothetical protein